MEVGYHPLHWLEPPTRECRTLDIRCQGGFHLSISHFGFVIEKRDPSHWKRSAHPITLLDASLQVWQFSRVCSYPRHRFDGVSAPPDGI
jgi:hypothetical protein